jgi:hypothetical protein
MYGRFRVSTSTLYAKQTTNLRLRGGRAGTCTHGPRRSIGFLAASIVAIERHEVRVPLLVQESTTRMPPSRAFDTGVFPPFYRCFFTRKSSGGHQAKRRKEERSSLLSPFCSVVSTAISYGDWKIIYFL